MGLILWIVFGGMYLALAACVAYIAACIVILLYNAVKIVLGTLYEDWCEMRLNMAHNAAMMRRVREAAKKGETLPDEEDQPDEGTNGTPVRQPAVATALGHIIRHPSMDGLVTGLDNTTVTRFNRNN